MIRYCVLLTLGLSSCCIAEELHIPASTVYLKPDGRGARVDAKKGVLRWTDPKTSVAWYGNLKKAGDLYTSIQVSLPAGKTSKLKLTVTPTSKTHSSANPPPDQSNEVTVSGKTEPISVSFGQFEIKKPGYYCFRLESQNEPGQQQADIQELVLSGPASEEAHFNLKPRRNAASVHLSYPVERGTEVSAFYCEMTGLEDPLWSYYMACGWHRGYFGMQVNSPTERRIIFSVWDSGGEAIDRKKVADENRVTLVDKGEGVYSGDFGNEGTGGHSHLKFQWKTGAKQKFLVTAEPVSKTHTVYAGYYFRPDQKKWMLISSWKAPKEGGYMRGLYSFSENFVGRNGNVVRKALYGNQWLRTADGKWDEVTTAKFSHDQTGKADRLDRFMGLEKGQFFLSHGGFIDGFTKFGTPFTRQPTGNPPSEQKLPPLPAAK